MSGHFDDREKWMENLPAELAKISKDNKSWFHRGIAGIALLPSAGVMGYFYPEYFPYSLAPTLCGLGWYIFCHTKLFKIGKRLDEIKKKLGQ